MKKTLILICLIPIISISQIDIKLDGTLNKKIYIGNINHPVGTSIKLEKIYNSVYEGLKASVIPNENTSNNIPYKHLKNISFSFNNTKEFWQSKALSEGVYENLLKNGFQYKKRKEIEEEALEYINYTANNGLIYEDSYLESYLYSLANKVYPIRIEDGRPGILNVKILKDVSPNAFIFSNGTMFISTGLLSTLKSEEELLGVIAHEISHFVLDHSMININKAIERRKKAEFWAAFATGLAAAAEGYSAASTGYYSGGTFTMSTAILAYSIASEVLDRLGLEYSREQESKADESAKELMKLIDVDPTALSSALLKIKDFSIINGNYLAISGKGTHPSIDSRVSRIGYPTIDFSNVNYDRVISFVNSFNSIIQLNNKNFIACENLVKRNINAGVATEEDYVILAMVTTYMNNNEEKNKEALKYINIAKELNVSPTINIYKQESIILIRLNRLIDAKAALTEYVAAVKNEIKSLEKIKNSRFWSLKYNYLYNELEWSIKMINKVDKL